MRRRIFTLAIFNQKNPFDRAKNDWKQIRYDVVLGSYRRIFDSPRNLFEKEHNTIRSIKR